MPRPHARQVLVKVRATSLNYRDWLIATDRTGRFSPRRPLVPLSDGAGEVVATGADVTSLQPGDAVVGAFYPYWLDGDFDSMKGRAALGGGLDGMLAEYVVLEASGAVKCPSHLSFEEAATLPCAAVTAWVGLVEMGGLMAGQTVLALGTGGVSLFAVQIAKAHGARVLLTSSSQEKLSRCASLRPDVVLNYRQTPQWADRVLSLTGGHGADHCIEVGGSGTCRESLRAMRSGGRLSLVGLLTGSPADYEAVRELAGSRVQVDRFFVGSVLHLERLVEFLHRCALRPVIDKVFPFEEARAAFQHLGRGAHVGKVVIRL